MKVAEKQSKFEKRLITKMDAEKNKAEVAKRSYRRASNIILQQVNALEVKRTDLEITIEDKQDLLDDALYCTDFSINKYDGAKLALEVVQEQLADVEATLEVRRNLLKELE
jgi:hypothetical protein